MTFAVLGIPPEMVGQSVWVFLFAVGNTASFLLALRWTRRLVRRHYAGH